MQHTHQLLQCQRSTCLGHDPARALPPARGRPRGCEPPHPTIEMGGQTIGLSQQTNYPQDGKVQISLNPQHEAAFTLGLRIPAWSQQNTVEVNGEKVEGVKAGQ